MKRLLSVFCFVFLIAGSLMAQQHKGVDVITSYPQFRLLFHPDIAAADAATMPFVEGQMTKGKERFGIVLRGAAGTSSVIELLDGANTVLKAITVNDLFGKSSTSGVRLVSSQVTASNRRSENIYDVQTTQGNMQLILRAIATGDAEIPESQRLILTFAVKANASGSLALRLMLPTEGGVETRTNGFILSAKSGAAAVWGTVVPQPKGISAEKSAMVITGQPIEVQQSESALMWIVFEGSTASSAPAAKTQASSALDAALHRSDSPNLLIVSSTDRTSIRPSDTVALTLICVNVGTRGASGVRLNNPVPPGTEYLDRSATSEGAEVLYDRQSGAIRNITWKMTDELKPGDEKVVSFKAVVQ